MKDRFDPKNVATREKKKHKLCLTENCHLCFTEFITEPNVLY